MALERVRITGGPSPVDIRIVRIREDGSEQDITSMVKRVSFSCDGQRLARAQLDVLAEVDVATQAPSGGADTCDVCGHPATRVAVDVQETTLPGSQLETWAVRKDSLKLGCDSHQPQVNEYHLDGRVTWFRPELESIVGPMTGPEAIERRRKALR